MAELLTWAGSVLAIGGTGVGAYCAGAMRERGRWVRGEGWRAAAAREVTIRKTAEQIVAANRRGEVDGHG